jgi:hypothetical protein
MPDLFITKAKPNPNGKDRLGSTVPSQQLAGEWVDFKNNTSGSLSLNNVLLQHIAYPNGHPNGVWETACDFKGNLRSGEIVRVHSGGEIDLNLLSYDDRLGADHHVFTGNGYIWNNNRSDTPRLIVKLNGVADEIDRAMYREYPTEGKILVRKGNLLE